MGYWNIGMLEYWVWRDEIYVDLDDPNSKLKSVHHPLFIPNIPFFHHSIIPWVIKGQTSPPWGKIKAWSTGPGFFI
jgi:hypothetical protein